MESYPDMAHLRTFSAAAERNKVPIGDVLASYLVGKKSVLEIASGTLQHVTYLAARFPEVVWMPSDVDEVVLSHYEQLDKKERNINKPILLNILSKEFSPLSVDMILCVNMIHIAPWEATLGLVNLAARSLNKGGFLITYGPYFGLEAEEAPSNIAFDQSLRSQNSDWGIRDSNTVIEAAARKNLVHKDTISMPANNHILVFKSNM